MPIVSTDDRIHSHSTYTLRWKISCEQKLLELDTSNEQKNVSYLFCLPYDIADIEERKGLLSFCK